MKKRNLKQLKLNKQAISKISDLYGGRRAFETFVEYSCHPETCNGTQAETEQKR